jgi:hypothetical protein
VSILARKMILLFSLENKINGRSEGPILFGTNVALTFTHLKKMMLLLQLSARDQSGPGSALSSFIQVATCGVEDKVRVRSFPGLKVRDLTSKRILLFKSIK